MAGLVIDLPMNFLPRKLITPMHPTAVWMIIGTCVIVELVLTGADHGLWASPRLRLSAYENAGFWIGLLYNWRPNYPAQPYTMFATYGFLHGGLIHLTVNMLTLYSLCPLIVRRVGGAKFILLYVVSIIGGAIGFALLSDSIQPMVGASGALFGLTGAIVGWEYVDRKAAKLELWPVLQVIGFLVFLNVVLWWAMGGQLAWQTHLGGFLIGWLAAYLIDPKARNIEI